MSPVHAADRADSAVLRGPPKAKAPAAARGCTCLRESAGSARENRNADGGDDRGLAAPGKAAGFTLIEVLAALVIVALGMLGVIQAVSQTASNTSYLREKTLAHWVAMNRLTEVRLQAGAPKIDKTSDVVEMAGQRWRWTMNVTQTPVESIRRIDISVRAEDADKDSSLASITGFYGSAVAPSGSMSIRWQGSPQDADGRGGADEQQPPAENSDENPTERTGEDISSDSDEQTPEPENAGGPP